MTELALNFGIALGPQSVLGVADATIAALSGTVDETDGAVLGDPESGIGGSGIDISFLRNLREKAVVAGSLTAQPSDFLGVTVEAFTVVWALKGNGKTTTATPVFGDFIPDKGIDALYQSGGLVGEDSGGGTYVYKPANAIISTAKIFDSGLAWVIKDIVGNLSIDWTPGNVALITGTFSGIVDSFADLSFPTFSYGNQATLSAPVVQEVEHEWGISSVKRGFTQATTTIDNLTEDVPDSNATDGIRTRQTGREITHTASVFSDDGDVSFEYDELVRTTAPTEAMFHRIGVVATGSDTANAIRQSMPTPETRSVKTGVGGVDRLTDVTNRAVSTSANAEYELEFL